MKTRKLGSNGPTVGAIGFGCMSFAGFFGPTDERTSHACLDAVWDAGITFLDTAEIYGMGLSETILGSYFNSHSRDFKIATKAGIRPNNDPVIDNSPDYLRTALEGSLKRFGKDHIDLYYIHRREQSRPIEELIDTLQIFIKEGKIGGYGLSEVSPTTLRRAHAIHPCTAVQSEYSLWTRSPELGLIQDCKRLGVAFVPFSPIARGMLTDTPVKLESIQKGEFRHQNPRFMEPNYSDNIRQISKFQEFAKSRGWTTSATALAWVLAQGDHLIPIPATRTAKNLAEWATADQIQLSAQDMLDIEDILPIGWAFGDRYSTPQWVAPEKYS